MQKLITKAIQNKTPELYATEGQGKEAKAQAHFFSCYKGLAGFDWYMTEYDPEEKLAFGLVHGFDGFELGYFSIKEFEEINKKHGFNVIERDMYFDPCKLSDIY